MSIKFNNVIPFPKKKVDVNLNDMWESILQKQKEIDELDAKMADIMEQAIEIEKESQRLLDLAEKIANGNEDFKTNKLQTFT